MEENCKANELAHWTNSLGWLINEGSDDASGVVALDEAK